MCVRGRLNKLRRISTCYVFVLQEKSQQRRSYLASLYEYMQSCSKELIYLSGQQDRIIQRDWSDLMVDPPSVRMEYEVRGEPQHGEKRSGDQSEAGEWRVFWRDAK